MKWGERMDYIEREKAKETARKVSKKIARQDKRALFKDCAYYVGEQIEKALSEIPGKKATWKKSDIPGESFICSNCGGSAWCYDHEGIVAKSRYCPNCGSRMEG